jgi:hypothetical protein
MKYTKEEFENAKAKGKFLACLSVNGKPVKRHTDLSVPLLLDEPEAMELMSIVLEFKRKVEAKAVAV